MTTRDEFELARPYPSLDVPPPKQPVTGLVSVISTRRVGDTVVCGGYDADGLFCWIVSRINAESAQCAIVFDERQAQRYIDEFEAGQR